jgi:leader peptidase (prepilin peptidase) / N-methyltransferase
MSAWQDIDPAVLLVFAGIAGLLIGSFLNVCIYRLPRLSNRSVVHPRSRCWRCRAPIAWYDNIPLLSWVLLRGRCRNCKRVISIRYPLVEATTAAVFVLCVAKLGVSLPALKYLTFSSMLIALMATDFERHILPDEFTIGGTVVGLIFALLVPMERYLFSILLPVGWNERVYSLADAAFGAFVAGGSIWLMAYVYGRLRDVDALGFGDVKMIAMVGAFLGLAGALETLILGSMIGAVVGLAYILLAGKNWRTYQIPFGSFLGLAALVVSLYGEVIRPK